MSDENEALAKQRFMLMNLVRLVSLASVLFGIAVSQGVVDLPPTLGIVLAIAGFLGFFFGPNMLARGWRSDDQ